jgi:tRNA A37 threonylcarbamoyladenosine dehydratase
LIGYRIVNDDLEKSVPAFITLLESLYSNELGATPKISEAVAAAVEVEVKAEPQDETKKSEEPSSNKMTYGLFGLAAASIVGGVLLKTMKD